jgi:hypothetical protein
MVQAMDLAREWAACVASLGTVSDEEFANMLLKCTVLMMGSSFVEWI